MEYAKVKTAAQKFNVSQGTIRAWIKKGLISASRPGPRTTLVNIKSITDYLAACQAKDHGTDEIVDTMISQLSMN